MDTGFLPAWAQAIAAVMVGAVMLWILAKRGVRDALQQTAEGWKSLAEMRNQEIENLKKRMEVLESDHRRVIAENEQLRSLNIRYQAEILELRSRIVDLETLLRREGIEAR